MPNIQVFTIRPSSALCLSQVKGSCSRGRFAFIKKVSLYCAVQYGPLIKEISPRLCRSVLPLSFLIAIRLVGQFQDEFRLRPRLIFIFPDCGKRHN